MSETEDRQPEDPVNLQKSLLLDKRMWTLVLVSVLVWYFFVPKNLRCEMTSSPQTLYLRNNNAYDWLEVRVTINDRIVKDLPRIESGKMKNVWIGSQESEKNEQIQKAKVTAKIPCLRMGSYTGYFDRPSTMEPVTSEVSRNLQEQNGGETNMGAPMNPRPYFRVENGSVNLYDASGSVIYNYPTQEK